MKWMEAANYNELCEEAAKRLFAAVGEKAEAGLPSSVGLATGNTMLGVYKKLARLFNEARIDLSRLSTFNLDEYVLPPGRNVPPSHRLSYKCYMDENFFKLLDPALGFANVRMRFPDASRPLDYDREIESAGGLDFQLLGLGFNGHIAFNEPMSVKDISSEEFMDLPTRVVDLCELTMRTNCRLTAGNDQSLVPRQAVTMGMKPIMQAKEVLLLACFAEQAGPLRKIREGDPTPELPASCLLRHPSCTFIYASDIIKL